MTSDLKPGDLETLLVDLLVELGVQRPDSMLPGRSVSLSEGWALLELGRCGPVSQQHIVACLKLEKSSVSRLAAGLERRGWLTRERDPANRRYHRLTLTEEGRAVSREIEHHLRDRHTKVIAGLTPAEREALSLALPALTRALHTAGPESAGT
ncbi:MarR family winged helix-turn-helix transcriptional regulator [Rhizohabitans arisaemae]|uniref:MarR family winged helix-turn-helix transcriptional regulator n=1 Tax=Rhizohabitans arisaemae TaxID=2720610 RepID=UPI0024B09812|nr:MarR family transcriptional regulator [Rhizohabitans arisaemae]